MTYRLLLEKRRKDFYPGSGDFNEKILNTRVNKLGLSLKGSTIENCIGELFDQLEESKIKLRPKFYLSDGYGTCEGTANIGVAFWDIDNHLQMLGASYLGELYDIWDMRMVLRHEVGHAFCYSYKLYRRREFRKIFNVQGHFFNTYPMHDNFKKNPWSHDFVNPCGDHYAQKHPDDDFAETFATLLDPRTNWRRAYKHRRGALEKLAYVDSLIQELRAKPVLAKNDPDKVYGPIEEVTSTVREFFAAKRAQRN